MVTNTPKRHQKYAMPKFECRPRPFRSSIAHAPVTKAARPNRTSMLTRARKADELREPKCKKARYAQAALASTPLLIWSVPCRGRCPSLDDRDDVGNIPQPVGYASR